MPLPINVSKAIKVLKSSLSSLSKYRDDKELDTRWFKRIKDVEKKLNHMENLTKTLHSVGVIPLSDSLVKDKSSNSGVNCPLLISLDLGLTQRRQHYHGQILFQCIAIPSNYFENCHSVEEELFITNDTLLSSSGKGVKISEGGRYDDLVRKSRPPGPYTTSIPKCVGVRFAIGKLVELMYLESSLSNTKLQEFYDVSRGSNSDGGSGLDTIRASLGLPINSMPQVSLFHMRSLFLYYCKVRPSH
jgi:hypothetical protein